MITPLPGIQLVNHPPGKAFALPLVQWLAQGQPTWLYFTSTTAPASVNFFLMFSASSLETPSFTGLGAPSTRSLASFRPRLVTSRTALMTLILFAPTSFSTTVNSVFSSAGAAPAAAPAPPPAMTTGAAAAADTPKRSSSFFTSAAASSSDSPTICSSNCCKSAISISTLRYQFLLFGTVCPVSSALSNPAAPDSRQEPGSQPLAPDNQILTLRRLSRRRA